MASSLCGLFDKSPCSACPLRGRTRVQGEGDEQSRIVVIGQCPGNEEMRLGRPFMGADGRRMNRALLEMGLRRPEPYLSNIDRLPTPLPNPDLLTPIWLTNVVKCYLPAKAAVPFEATLCCWISLRTELLRHCAIHPDLLVVITVGSIAKNTIQQHIDAGDFKGFSIAHRPVIHPAATLYRASNDIILTQQCVRIRKELEQWKMVGRKCVEPSMPVASSTTTSFLSPVHPT